MPLPLRNTIRIASMKYLRGLKAAIHCAQSGIPDTGVNSPEISIKTNIKKNIRNIACCIVEA